MQLRIDGGEDWDHIQVIYETLGPEDWDLKRLAGMLDQQPPPRKRKPLAAVTRARVGNRAGGPAA